VRGHEFHRTLTEPAAGSAPAWTWDGRAHGFSVGAEGRASVHSSYLHLHWAGVPQAAQRFAEAAAQFAGTGSRHARPTEPPPIVRVEIPAARPDGIDLAHHGDRDLGPGLVDLAVNVLTSDPPPWLAEAIARLSPPLGRYPDVRPAREAIAARHGVDVSMVLPTSGGAEASTLIAHGLPLTNPMVVHPQFTEPEAALRAAGRAVQRWLLPVTAGAGTPDLGELPSWADGLFVGNPTNPTGWLHRREALLAAGQGRLLVVDEAFMDATDEAESLIEPHMAGRLVLRSLSKTWGLAGLRVGYVVGDPALIAALERMQPPWSVSSPAIAAMIATASAEAVAEAAAVATTVRERRVRFVADLRAAGFGVPDSHAPFVLIDTASCGRESVRPALAAKGFAVRRGESFPGLGPTWIRVRVPDDWRAFVDALTSLRH
jgi:cobyrinic acid a,c-diamide synthase